ncbi:MAG: hypothetical protein ACFFDT_21945 [Candidatus Hodarchaeota archaeon]
MTPLFFMQIEIYNWREFFCWFFKDPFGCLFIQKDDLLNRQIIAVINFPPKQITDFMSEVLILEVLMDRKGEVVLLQPDRILPNGLKNSLILIRSTI